MINRHGHGGSRSEAALCDRRRKRGQGRAFPGREGVSDPTPPRARVHRHSASSAVQAIGSAGRDGVERRDASRGRPRRSSGCGASYASGSRGVARRLPSSRERERQRGFHAVPSRAGSGFGTPLPLSGTPHALCGRKTVARRLEVLDIDRAGKRPGKSSSHFAANLVPRRTKKPIAFNMSVLPCRYRPHSRSCPLPVGSMSSGPCSSDVVRIY